MVMLLFAASYDTLHLTRATDTAKTILLHKDSSEPSLLTIIALLAVVLSPLVQLLVGWWSRRSGENQLRATVRSNNRQQWVHILRDQLSEFTSQLMGLILNIDPGPPIKVKDQKVHQEKSERLIFLQTKIELLLNPNKPEQKVIIDLVDNARLAAIARDTEALDGIQKELTQKSQVLFKHTWERIKNLD